MILGVFEGLALGVLYGRAGLGHILGCFWSLGGGSRCWCVIDSDSFLLPWFVGVLWCLCCFVGLFCGVTGMVGYRQFV